MSNKIGQALGNAFNTIANQAQQTANDIGQGVSNAVSNAEQAVADGINEFAEGTAKEMNDVGEKAKNGDFLGAAMELTEVGGFGTMGSEALAAMGLGPKDPFGKEVMSGLLNAMAGNPIGAFKDMGDAFGALAASNPTTGSSAKPAKAHHPLPPGGILQAAKDAIAQVNESLKGEGQKADRPHRYGRGYASININVNINVNGQIRPGCTSGHWHHWMMQKPIIMRPPAIVLADVIRPGIGAALENVGAKPSGPPCRDKPMSDRSIGDILNDPSLSFEDMVAMVMAKVCDQMQEQVREQIEKLDKMTASKDSGGSSSTSKADGQKGASGAEGASGGGGSPRAEGGEGSRGAAKNPLEKFFVTDPKQMAFLALDSIIAGPIGMAIGMGLTESGSLSKELLGSLDPKMIGGLVEGAKALTPILAPLVSGACAAFPPIGTAIAPFVPMLLPVVMDLAGGALQSAAGAARDDQPGSSSAGGRPDPSATAPGKGSVGGTGGKEQSAGKADQDSINLEMEKLKLLMQRMQQMQQSMSNILNSMHQGAMNAIRNIK